MGLALSRLAVHFARGRAGYHKNRAQREQQDFENDQTAARTASQQLVARSLLEQRAHERQQSTAQQHLALEMRNRRVKALVALGYDPVTAEAFADDDVAFRGAMRPEEPPRIDPLSDEGLERRRGFVDFQHGRALERLKAQMAGRGRTGRTTTPNDPDDDVPRFLRPDIIAGRAAELVKPQRDKYGRLVPGFTPEAAADSARKEADSQRQAGFAFESASLQARLERDLGNAANDPAAQQRARAAHEQRMARLRQRYGMEGR